jgi:hypothetical protein
MSQDYSPGRQNSNKCYAIAVDQVLTACWSWHCYHVVSLQAFFGSPTTLFLCRSPCDGER